MVAVMVVMVMLLLLKVVVGWRQQGLTNCLHSFNPDNSVQKGSDRYDSNSTLIPVS